MEQRVETTPVAILQHWAPQNRWMGQDRHSREVICGSSGNLTSYLINAHFKENYLSIDEDLFHSLFISLLHKIQILKSYYNLFSQENMTHVRAQ